ncbi:MAG: hypothetical protein E6K63_14675 [Nitrospirae bacterium]|nr:MAG: hypothetical protein E6K63_14675 [Nitrospirota bacterium]
MATSIPSRALLKDLQQLLRTRSVELRLIQQQWTRVQRKLTEEQNKLRIPGGDPIYERAELLGPLGADTDEVLHTRALAYLLDPSRPHGFGSALLKRFLLGLRGLPNVRWSQLEGIIRLIRQTKVDVRVIPERRHLSGLPRRRRYPRTDLWIEIHFGDAARLIVIENKIVARESDQQLRDYERIAHAWCNKHACGEPLLVFLTPGGVVPQSGTRNTWVSVTYARMAGSLRKTCLSHPNAAGFLWGRLYIASILQGILGLRLDRGHAVDLTRLREYLGVANS